MAIASFFAGIGGLEKGLEAAGLGPVVFQCEKDPFARRVLEKHWPGVARYDDIRTLEPSEIPRADVWCGGFPCTDISVAGKGAGIHDGEHPSLWWDWYGLIREVRPRVVVVGNVAAFLGRGLLDVLGALAEVGYDAEWHSLSAADVGAPHLRKRVFIIAWLPDALGNTVRDEPRRVGGTRGTASEAEPGRDGAEGDVADADGGGRSYKAASEVRSKDQFCGPNGTWFQPNPKARCPASWDEAPTFDMPTRADIAVVQMDFPSGVRRLEDAPGPSQPEIGLRGGCGER